MRVSAATGPWPPSKRENPARGFPEAFSLLLSIHLILIAQAKTDKSSMPDADSADIEQALCSEPLDLKAAIPHIKQIISKDFNGREKIVELLQQKGADILRNILKADDLAESTLEDWKHIVLLAVLTIKHATPSSLIYLIQLIPDRAAKLGAGADVEHYAVSHMSQILEFYVRKLVSNSITRFPLPPEDTETGSAVTWKTELAYVRPIVNLLLTVITNRQGEYANATEIEPLQERDVCSGYISILSLLLIFEAGKRTFVEADGFTVLMMVAAQTQSVPVVSAILTAFHSCVFNLIDSVNDELDTPAIAPASEGDNPKQTTVYNLVVDAFAFVRPHELINSIYERFYKLQYVPKQPIFTEDRLKQQLNELVFSIVLLFHDCALPETAGFVTKENLLFVAQYIISVARDVNLSKPALWQSDGSLATFNAKIKGGIEALMRLISLHTETPAAIRTLIYGCDADTQESDSTQPEEPAMKGDSTNSVNSREYTPKKATVPGNIEFLRAVINAVAVTDCSTLAGTLLSFLSLVASYSCCYNQALIIPLEFTHYERILRWISAYGSYILGGRSDTTKIIQNMEDACLVLVWLVENSSSEIEEAATAEDVLPKALTRDEIWARLSIKQEAHGVLMLAMAMSVVKGLVPTLTGLLSVISCFMGTDGYFIQLLEIFKEKKAEICNFLVDLCANLSKQGAFCYVVCNNILKGMSSLPDAFSSVDVNHLADALLPLGFSDGDDDVLMKIVGSYKEIPPVIKESCKKILAIMDAVDGEPMGAEAESSAEVPTDT